MSDNVVSPLKYFISGGFGGMCTVLTGHPLDTLKVRLQTMPVPGPGEQPLYKGTLDCLMKTVRLEGILGLYKGMAAPLVGISPIFAISFFGYGLGKRLQQKQSGDPLTNEQMFYAGCFSGIFTTVIMAPGERLKCLLQIQHGMMKPKYKGPIDCAKQLYREGGIPNIYKGTCATLLRDVPGSGVYFLAYEVLKKYLMSDEINLGMVGGPILSGGLAGIIMWVVAMPADVLKSRFQTSPEGKYTGVRQVFTILMKEEGPRALYRGFLPVLLRAFPANAACFLGFELSLRFLNWVAPNF